VGVPKKGQNISIYSLPLHFGKEIKGSHGGEAIPHEDIPRYHAMYRSGRIKLKELVTDDFSLDEINTAIQKMRDGTLAGRCQIRMSS
jgi:Zn-dependent alcohol dehydrogenase